MVDFSHLRALDQRADVDVPYKMEQIAGTPTIWFKPGTDANPSFMNETLRRANLRSRSNRRSKRLTKEVLSASREEDKEVLSKCCATRWDVKDAKGKPVDFSEENCLEFFQALPDWLFDDVRTFVTDPGNFLDDAAGEDGLGEA